MVKFDPAKGQEAAEVVTKYCDEIVQETANLAYEAIKALGEDNHIVEELKQKMVAFQSTYNDGLVPAFNSGNKAFNEFTDMAEYISKLDIDTSVAQADVGTVQSGMFDAAMHL